MVRRRRSRCQQALKRSRLGPLQLPLHTAAFTPTKATYSSPVRAFTMAKLSQFCQKIIDIFVVSISENQLIPTQMPGLIIFGYQK